MSKLVIVGSGGHAKSVYDAANACGLYEIVGFVGPDSGVEYRGAQVVCNDDEVGKLVSLGVTNAAFGIGFLGGLDIREDLFSEMKRLGFSFPAIVDPTSAIASDAMLGEGCFVGKNAVVNSGARVGRLSIVNSGAIVEHDCVIGDWAHVSVGTILCGGVTVGKSAFVGAGATVIQGISIGCRSLVGAGSTVLVDVQEGGRALGVYSG